ncbi:hypothetical protein [Okeania sp. SIO2B3]|nr:hypothetical protein [Okeania sp. SIO2B3]
MNEEVGAKFCQSDFSAFASVKILTFLTTATEKLILLKTEKA